MFALVASLLLMAAPAQDHTADTAHDRWEEAKPKLKAAGRKALDATNRTLEAAGPRVKAGERKAVDETKHVVRKLSGNDK